MNRLTFIAATASFSLFAGGANSITPASPAQILCTASAAFVGTVLDARSHDCRLRSKEEYCSGASVVGATIKVDQMLQPAPDGFDPTQRFDVALYGRNGSPMKIGEKFFPMNASGNGMIGFPPTGKGISDSEAKQVLVGHQYVFAIRKRGTDQTWLKEPYFASAYEGADQDWVRQEWPTADCDRWRHN